MYVLRALPDLDIHFSITQLPALSLGYTLIVGVSNGNNGAVSSALLACLQLAAVDRRYFTPFMRGDQG